MRGRAPGRVEPKAIRHYVAAREAGRPVTGPDRRPRMIDQFLPKIAEWVERSKGRARADVVPGGLVGLRLTGVEWTTRRAAAEVEAAWRVGNLRTYRPWITEPGLWLQVDRGRGPAGAGPGWDAAADVAVLRPGWRGPGSG